VAINGSARYYTNKENTMNKFVLALALCTMTSFTPAVVAVSPQDPEVPAEQNKAPKPTPQAEADCEWVVPHCDSVEN